MSKCGDFAKLHRRWMIERNITGFDIPTVVPKCELNVHLVLNCFDRALSR